MNIFLKTFIKKRVSFHFEILDDATLRTKSSNSMWFVTVKLAYIESHSETFDRFKLNPRTQTIILFIESVIKRFEIIYCTKTNYGNRPNGVRTAYTVAAYNLKDSRSGLRIHLATAQCITWKTMYFINVNVLKKKHL